MEGIEVQSKKFKVKNKRRINYAMRLLVAIR